MIVFESKELEPDGNEAWEVITMDMLASGEQYTVDWNPLETVVFMFTMKSTIVKYPDFTGNINKVSWIIFLNEDVSYSQVESEHSDWFEANSKRISNLMKEVKRAVRENLMRSGGTLKSKTYYSYPSLTEIKVKQNYTTISLKSRGNN